MDVIFGEKNFKMKLCGVILEQAVQIWVIIQENMILYYIIPKQINITFNQIRVPYKNKNQHYKKEWMVERLSLEIIEQYRERGKP